VEAFAQQRKGGIEQEETEKQEKKENEEKKSDGNVGPSRCLGQIDTYVLLLVSLCFCHRGKIFFHTPLVFFSRIQDHRIL